MIGGDRLRLHFRAAQVERGFALEHETAKVAQVPAIIRYRIVGRAQGFAQRCRE
jgi:hypothetical protein